MKYTYLLIDFFTILVPFIASFDKRIHFVKQWRYYFPANIFVAVCFLFWFLKGLNEVAVNANVVEENVMDSFHESDTTPVPLIVHSSYIPPVAKPNPDFILFEELGGDTITKHQKSFKFNEYEFKAKIKKGNFYFYI